MKDQWSHDQQTQGCVGAMEDKVSLVKDYPSVIMFLWKC